MMKSGSEHFNEESQHQFQKLFRTIASMYIAVKKQESPDKHDGYFNIIDRKSRQCRSMPPLLRLYNLQLHEFGWADGWYNNLEMRILEEIDYRITALVPETISTQVLALLLIHYGTKMRNSLWLCLCKLSRSIQELAYLRKSTLIVFYNFDSRNSGIFKMFQL